MHTNRPISDSKSILQKRTIIFLFCIGLISILYSFNFKIESLGIPNSVAKWIIDNHSIPKTDFLSWISDRGSLTFIAHDWLSDIIIFFIYNIAGYGGISFVCVLFVFAFCVLAYFAGGKEITYNTLWAFFFFALFVVAFKNHTNLNSDTLVLFLIFAELFILYKYMKEESGIIWFLPLIGCLWANIQGSTSNLSYILSFLFVLSHMFNKTFGKIQFKKANKAFLGKPFLATLLCVSAICINPYGMKMLSFPYTYKDGINLSMIFPAYAAPDAKNVMHLICYFVPLFFVTAHLITTKKKIRGFDFIMFAIFAFLVFRSMKNINLFLITSSFYVFRYTIPYKDMSVGKFTLPKFEAKTVKNAVVITAIFAIAGIISGIVIHNNEAKNDNSFYLSKDAISFVNTEQPQALFNNIDFSAELIENKIPVFVDSRVSVYGKKDITNYLKLTSVLNSEKYTFKGDSFMTEILDMYNFDSFLVNKSDSLYAYLVSFPEQYNLTYSDDKVAYFKKIN
jgi:hypothetical protein